MPRRNYATGMKQVPVGLVQMQQRSAAHMVQIYDSCLFTVDH